MVKDIYYYNLILLLFAISIAQESFVIHFLFHYFSVVCYTDGVLSLLSMFLDWTIVMNCFIIVVIRTLYG